jgi:hypothetical protein
MDARVCIQRMLIQRETSICPSEVARKLDPDDWRNHMTAVHQAVDQMIAEQQITVTQNGVRQPVRPRGPYRINPYKPEQ